MKTAAEPHVKRELNNLQARLGHAGTQLQNAIATVNGQKKFLAASQHVHASTEKVETVDATAERSGTAGVSGVHQIQRTVDASSGLSQDLSSLDEDDNLVQQRRHVARCRVRSWSGSS